MNPNCLLIAVKFMCCFRASISSLFYDIHFFFIFFIIHCSIRESMCILANCERVACIWRSVFTAGATFIQNYCVYHSSNVVFLLAPLPHCSFSLPLSFSLSLVPMAQCARIKLKINRNSIRMPSTKFDEEKNGKKKIIGHLRKRGCKYIEIATFSAQNIWKTMNSWILYGKSGLVIAQLKFIMYTQDWACVCYVMSLFEQNGRCESRFISPPMEKYTNWNMNSVICCTNKIHLVFVVAASATPWQSTISSELFHSFTQMTCVICAFLRVRFTFQCICGICYVEINALIRVDDHFELWQLLWVKYQNQYTRNIFKLNCWWRENLIDFFHLLLNIIIYCIREYEIHAYSLCFFNG